MTKNKQRLHKLIALARQAHAPAPAPVATGAPFGFATRIAAQWASGRQRVSRGALWERFCWWGAVVSVAVCLVAFSHQPPRPEPGAFDMILGVRTVDLELP